MTASTALRIATVAAALLLPLALFMAADRSPSPIVDGLTAAMKAPPAPASAPSR